MSFGSFGSQNQPSGGGGFGSSSGFGSTSGSGGFGSGSGFGGTNNAAGGSSFSFGGSTNAGSSFGGGNASGQGGFTNANNDYEIPIGNGSPTDSISCLQWSPANYMNLLVSGSWDGRVRCYMIDDNGSALNANLRAYCEHPAPVLDVCFKEDGSGCFSGGCSNMVKMWTFENGGAPGSAQNAVDVGKHDGIVKSVRWIPQKSLLASGGYDKKLCYWDLRSPNPALQVQLPGRVDCMDIVFPYCVVGTGGTEQERQVLIYNLNTNPSQPERVLSEVAQSGAFGGNKMQASSKPLKKQYRSCAIFPDVSGFAIASIEGRCSIQYFGMNQIGNNFAFKCHRDKTSKLIYSVNSLAFHKQFGTFATAGSDGMWNFWDKDSKQRLKASSQVKFAGSNEPGPITCSGFNSGGNLFAYACSYDWSKGFQGVPPNNPSTIFIHRTLENEVKPKKQNQNGRGRSVY